MDVYEYFHSRERECREHSLAPDTSFEDMFGEEAGSEGQRGIVWGRLVLSDRAYLSVFERVVVTGSSIHREQYSYYLIVDDDEAWGFDRDLTHTPAEHGHVGSDHKRVPAPRVTFPEVVEKAWATVSEIEGLPSLNRD